MYPVTTDFLDKMKADRRQVLARAVIDYTDPFMDQSLEISASEQANVSCPEQTADSVQEATHKWASLDGSWTLDGTYHLAPPPEKLAQFQFGWWGKQLAGTGGAFSAPYPALTVAHLPRPIHALRVVGDTARKEYPVDFEIKLYAADGTLLYTETVSGNMQVAWNKILSTPILDVARQVLTITKWSHEGRQAKIIEFFTSIREIYEIGDLMSLHLLEERDASQGSLPVGNISSNEIALVLNNESKKFDADNDQSPLKNLLKPNRRIQVWLGAEVERIINERAIEFAEFNASFPTFYEILKYGSDEPSEHPLFFEIVQDGTAGFEQSLYIHRETDSGNYRESLINKAVSVDIDVTELSAITLYINRIRIYSMGLQCWLDDTIVLSTTTPGWNQYSIDVSGLSGTKTLKIGVYAWGTPFGGEYLICGIEKHFSEPVIEKETEYVPLGTFWSLDWDSPDDTLEATVTARDRLELLRRSTYQPGAVQQNVSPYTLAEQVLQDAGLQSGEYWIDPALQQIVIPWAWLSPTSHREALRIIAEAALAVVYADRDGIVRIESMNSGTGDSSVLEITEDDYFPPLRAPSRQDQVANEIIVDTQPLRPATTSEEVYRSNEPITIPGNSTKTVTAFYNSPPAIDAAASLDNPPAGVSITDVSYYGWGASVKIRNTNATDKQATLVIQGKPLTVRNKERAIARDEASILENGALRFEFPANPLVQTLAQAQAIANALLASVKDPRRDVEVEWRGNPALLLGDRVTVKGKDYHVIRQEISWAGYMQARLTGRKAER